MNDWVTNAWRSKYTSLYIWYYQRSPTHLSLAPISWLNGLDAMAAQIFSYCIITTQRSMMAAMMISIMIIVARFILWLGATCDKYLMLNAENQILNVKCKNLNCHKLIWIFCTAAGVGPFVTNVNRWRKSGTPLILIPQNFPIERPTCDEAEHDKD